MEELLFSSLYDDKGLVLVLTFVLGKIITSLFDVQKEEGKTRHEPGNNKTGRLIRLFSYCGAVLKRFTKPLLQSAVFLRLFSPCSAVFTGFTKPLLQGAVFLACFLGVYGLLDKGIPVSWHAYAGDNFYYGEKGFTPNLDKAVYAYKEAATRGDGYSCYMLGIIYMEREQDFDTVFWLNKGIANRDAQSAVALGGLYLKGLSGKLTPDDRREKAYSAYSTAKCLGDTSVDAQIKGLEPGIPASVKGELAKLCTELRQREGS